MPRIRTIKPDFFTSDTVSELPLRARLTWIGLWTHCDDHGRCRNNVKLIKAAVWPLDDVSLRDVAEDLDALAEAGVIYLYAVDDRTYLQVTGWTEHQKVDRPSKSAIPAPLDEPSVSMPRALDEPASSPRARKGRERKGREGEPIREPSTQTPATAPAAQGLPEPRCPTHLHNPKPPACGACADARKARTRWDTDRARASAAAPRCGKHRGEPAHNCGRCRSENLATEDAS